MDRQRGDRAGDKPVDRFEDGGGRRMPSRWSSGNPTHHQQHRYPRGGGGGGGGEGFSGGGSASGSGGSGRYHPYRGPQDLPPPGGGGFRGGGSGGFEPPMQMGGPRRGFSGRGASPPGHIEGHKFAKLFIGSVPRTATEEDIKPLFEEHGDVVEVAFIKDRKTGEQQGCCFVKYATKEEADRAIRTLHNQYTLPGGSGPIQVRYADGEREHHGSVEDKLFVASLNKQATAKEIEEIFSPYGRVEDVYIMRDSCRQSRGCGFVKFASREMAAAALKALNGVYVMRGCDQPLIVRFADPKRPRPAESSGGPAFGGPGMSPRSDAALVIRPTANLEEPRNGRMPPDAWHPRSPDSLPLQSCTLGPSSGPPNGTNLNLTAQQAFNPTIVPGRPGTGQQMSPLQKPHMLSQNFTSASSTQTLNYQAPLQQLGQLQVPQSGGVNSFNQFLSSQHLPGVGGLPSTSQPIIQQAVSSALQTPLNAQQQAIPAISQQQFPASASQQLLQQPVQQFPSQLPHMLLQQQAHALQSSIQSSQQAIIQLQQQLQVMQQHQASQVAKQQSAWTGPPLTSSTPVSTPSSTSVMPATSSATSSLSINTPSTVPLTCNWTEHTSPQGFKYYYNSLSRESRWEKPEEFTLFERQQQKLVLLQQQQQQQKHAVQQVPSQQLQSDNQSHAQVQTTHQVSQPQQVQSQMVRRQTRLQASAMYQTSSGAPQQNVQDINYPQLQVAGSVIDPSRIHQGVQAAPEWAWKNKSAGLPGKCEVLIAKSQMSYKRVYRMNHEE